MQKLNPYAAYIFFFSIFRLERERERGKQKERKKKGTNCRPLSLLIDESLCGPTYTSNDVVSHWSFRYPRMQFLPGWVTTHDDLVTFDKHSIHALLFSLYKKAGIFYTERCKTIVYPKT